MSHIYIFSPSSAVRDKAAFKRGIKRLEAQGHEVQIDPDALTSHMRFAGDDETRLKAIGRAAASGANIAMISRGGYGLTRLLTHLPYKAIAKSIDNGTQYVGLSDFTAFQLAVCAKTQRITWQGPALGEDFGPESEPDDIMQACFDDLCLEQGEGTGWRMPVESFQKNVKVNNAVLWGGNLAVLTSLLGTPYFPLMKKGVLFLEDVGEHPYKIERMLTQLLNAGVLQNQKAIVFGQFTS
ncbi:MAG: Murein tetrapeptide carboxypeptidase, partial [Pseudomonadota bacterium]